MGDTGGEKGGSGGTTSPYYAPGGGPSSGGNSNPNILANGQYIDPSFTQVFPNFDENWSNTAAASGSDPTVRALYGIGAGALMGSGGGAGGAGTGAGLSTADYLAIAGQAVQAYGAYKSTAANADAAARGPVLPQDVVAPRQALSDAFLRMILTPGGLDYGAPPFSLEGTEGNDPFAAVNAYRTSSQPLFENELNTALDTERAKLGGQYGIRFGTDLQRGLGDTVAQANASREGKLGELGVSAYDSFMNRQLSRLGLKTDAYYKQKFGLLPIVANYLGGQPSSSPFQGGSPGGQAFQALGSGLSNAPLYQYLNRKT